MALYQKCKKSPVSLASFIFLQKGSCSALFEIMKEQKGPVALFRTWKTSPVSPASFVL